MNRRHLLTGFLTTFTGLLGFRRAEALPAPTDDELSQLRKEVFDALRTHGIPAKFAQPHHTCRPAAGGLTGPTKDRLYAELIERHLGTADGRSRLLQSTRVLSGRPNRGCAACEVRTQRHMKLILDHLEGNEPGWMAEGYVSAEEASARLRQLLEQRQTSWASFMRLVKMTGSRLRSRMVRSS
jgi:hypothetical protein